MSPALCLDLRVPLDRFDLAVRWETDEPFLGVFGASGAGKTTLLEAIAGLRPEARGVVRVGGATWLDTDRGIRLPPERRGVGYVPQDALLFPHRDVAGNLAAGARRARGRSGPAIDDVAAVLELGPLLRRDVAALSGGEKQRVALGRALCSAPDLLLLDEPLAGVDLPLRRRILTALLRARREFRVPLVCVSHDPTEIQALAREIVVLAGGAVVARGAPGAVLTSPAVLPLASGAGFENVLSGRVGATRDGAATVTLDRGPSLAVPGDGLRPGQDVLVGLRAEDLLLALALPVGLSARNVLPGTVRAVSPPASDGGVAVLVALGGDHVVVVALTGDAVRDLAIRPGLAVHLIAKARACRILASL